ncbi:MAG TPA: hypothetical protein VKF40_26395 [Burkholderiales bacterium]|nr:hypothetical protein [Burkholderiales bacterium]
MIRCLVMLFAIMLSAPVIAQDPRVKEMEVLAQSVKADKKQLVSRAMQLTEAEGKRFWPIYEAYQKDLHAMYDRLAKVIVAYADAYKKGPLPDEMAKKLVAESIAVEDAEVKLKRSYAEKLNKALPGAKAARYLLIENKIRAIVRYELASNIPLPQ